MANTKTAQLNELLKIGCAACCMETLTEGDHDNYLDFEFAIVRI